MFLERREGPGQPRKKPPEIDETTDNIKARSVVTRNLEKYVKKLKKEEKQYWANEKPKLEERPKTSRYLLH